MEKAIGSAKAAKIIGVTPARVAQLCKAGLLDAQLIGNTWVIDSRSVANYAQARRLKKQR